tara:strand:- start:851 stop:1108 length:258 start_codon:yes stop_codon:yes gene_type:complete
MKNIKQRAILFIFIILICSIAILILDLVLPFFDSVIGFLLNYKELTAATLLGFILYKSFNKDYDLIFFISIGLLTGFLMSFFYPY